jgi:hypothetical protein
MRAPSMPASTNEWIEEERKIKSDTLAAFLSERCLENAITKEADIEDLALRLLARAEESRLSLRPPGAPLERFAVVFFDAAVGAERVLPVHGSTVAAEIDAKRAAGDSLVCAEVALLLEDTAQRAGRAQAQGPEGVSDVPQSDAMPSTELLARLAEKSVTMAEVEDLPSWLVSPALAYRVRLALVWPEAWAEWSKYRERQDKAWAERIRAHRAAALDFAREQIQGQGLTPAEVEAVAGLLADLDLQPVAAAAPTAPDNGSTFQAKEALRKWSEDLDAASKSGDRVRLEALGKQQDRLTWWVGFSACWPRAWAQWLEANAPRLAARVVLQDFAKADGENSDLADDPHAEGRLEQAVRERLPEAAKAVAVPENLEDLGERDGMYALYARFADYVSALPYDNAKRWADEQRGEWKGRWRQQALPEAKSDWERWRDPLTLPRLLARALWPLRVRPQLRSSIPAVWAVGVVNDLAESHWANGRQLVMLEGKMALRKNGVDILEVPIIDPADFEAMQRGAERLGSVTGQRTIRFLARRACELHNETPGRADVVIEGGFSGLAELLGERSKKAPEAVRDVLRAGQAFARRWANGSEIAGLWTYRNEVAEARGRRALLVVTVGTVLRPYYALEHLPPGKRFGVPVLPMPPFVGRQRGWAAQAVFQMVLEGKLVERRLELIEEGGVKLTSTDFDRLAQQAGLPLGSWRKVIDRWTQDGTDGPAMLERVGPERFNLADREPYRAARNYLMQGGRITADGRKRAQRKTRGRIK